MATSWQQTLYNLFTTIPPNQVGNRDPYWKDTESGIHSPSTNNVVRVRDYTTDGNHTHQKSVLASGQNAGIIALGNDNGNDYSAVIEYANIMLMQGGTFHVSVPNNNFLWNGCPINPTINPNFVIPPGLSEAEQAFQFATGFSEGTLGDLQNSVLDILTDAQALGADTSTFTGFQDYSSPFAAFCTLMPQKIPLYNFGMILFLQMLLKMPPGFMMAGEIPVTLGPIGELVAPLAQIDFQTAFNAEVTAKVLGAELQSLMLSSVPGMNLAAGLA